MFVCIVGGGRTGSQLATELLEQKHKVRLIENRREMLDILHHELPTEVIYEGLAADPSILRQAGMGEADVAVACTTDDAVNLIICYLARTMFNVKRTIARINNPHHAWLFDKSFHVDESVNNANVMAHLIQEEMSLGDMMTLLKLRRGRYAVVEEKIPAGALAVGKDLKTLSLPEECVIAGIIRDGHIVLPRGGTILKAGDEVLAVTNTDGAKELSKLFEPPTRPAQP